MSALAFLIPTRSRHATLAKSLATVLPAARSAGAEVIVCDQSVVAFMPPDGVLVRHQPDLAGLPAARNALLRGTSASVVVFLDDDTDLAADFGLQVLALAAAEPDTVAWGPVCEIRGRWTRRLHRLAQLGVFADPRRLTNGPCDRPTRALFGCCFAVRRKAALTCGFDARRAGYALGEDYDFFLRLPGRKRFSANLQAEHRKDGAGRLDLRRRGCDKARFLLWIARRHGGRNPVTIVHLVLALVGAAIGAGHEPAAWSGVLGGLWRPDPRMGA